MIVLVDKNTRQREKRRAFKIKHGYSMSANYRAGGQRAFILSRDNYCCVACGMSDAEHKRVFGRPITIDHKDRNRKNNDPDNLQTMCLVCHGRKDLIAELRKSKVEPYKEKIMALRNSGMSCNQISKQVGVTCAMICKWIRRWNKGQL